MLIVEGKHIVFVLTKTNSKTGLPEIVGTTEDKEVVEQFLLLEDNICRNAEPYILELIGRPFTENIPQEILDFLKNLENR